MAGQMLRVALGQMARLAQECCLWAAAVVVVAHIKAALLAMPGARAASPAAGAVGAARLTTGLSPALGVLAHLARFILWSISDAYSSCP